MNKMELKPYKGYIVIPRGIILPFLGKPLHILEFGAFITIAIECDWDKDHSTYGCLTKSDMQLATRWGCNPTTVWRYKQRLFAMGLLVPHGTLVKVKHFEWFEVLLAKQLAKEPLTSVQDLFAISQDIIANTQEDIAVMQKPQGQNTPQSFKVSSKGDLSVSKGTDDYDVISDEELDRIADEIDKQKGY